MESPQFIHGILHATILQASNLHHSGLVGFAIEVAEKVEEGLRLHFLPHSKIYATIDIGTARVARTREIEFHPKNPIWNEQFRLYCAHSASAVTISIKDQLPVSARVIGRSKIPISQILTTQPIESWFDLYNDEGEKLEKAQIHVRLQFVHAESDPNWNNGLKNSSFSGLPNSFFPQRTNCRVTLYQNSHLSSEFRPKIHLSGNKLYRAHRYWEDLYNSIIEAKHFIYVVGWSVNVSITLIRDPERMIPGAENVTIGELLKKKADEGLTVLVMIWQDRTSFSFLGNPGVMDTHDESTFNFFEQGKVKCFLCPRNPDSSLTAVQGIEVIYEFTHHQKTITLDAPIAGDEFTGRKIVSYVGGIDLCDGRYDNEKHPLFRTLDTIYLHDFQQENIQNADLHHGGPREAWHDCHSRLEGLAAWDVLTNFEHRWMKQSPDELSGCLLKIRQNPQVFPTPSEEISDFEEPTWNVQVFRSIDDASVVGFPEDPAEAASLGLMSGKDVTIDQSIHHAYIEAIRRANRFIYIENQYFCGSCSSWSEDQDCGCLNLIPMEIALKIASKIRQGERFAVYIITPMWPGGVPEGETVQAILHWNRLTMEMMFGIIATAIEEMGLKDEVSPGDYLNFFCLGNREMQNPGEYVPPEKPEEGTNYWKSQVNRRFMIYVHAKIMIVDDEYVIVGSANLNQRSLDGGRDSEIVQGSYQPEYINRPEGAARGHVHGYRMSLWYEHFASHYPELMHVFMEAESVECVRTVKKIAMKLWEEYIGEEVVDLPGHLLPFPIQVSQDGSITELPESGCFPDTTASMKGKTSSLRPAIITS